MTKWFGFLCILIALCSCSRPTEQGFFSKASTNNGLVCQSLDGSNTVEAKAIYGTDNRLDWFESPGDTKNYWAKATLALIPKNAMTKRDGKYQLNSMTYKERAGLCEGNPFAEQPTPAVCSGFLVSEDMVVTAGHCVVNSNDCSNINFVFDFAKLDQSQKEYTVNESSVYSCVELVKQSVQGDDFAVIKLDRPVSGRTPLNLRRSGLLSIGEQVMLIGHPMGLPSKIADGGIVQSVGRQIVATVDAFSANSGSAVLNTQTGLVEGILVAGEPDFKYAGGCRVEAVCGSNCSGEGITPISKILPYIPNKVYKNPVCE